MNPAFRLVWLATGCLLAVLAVVPPAAQAARQAAGGFAPAVSPAPTVPPVPSIAPDPSKQSASHGASRPYGPMADLPEALAPWRAWALYGHEDRLCPPRHDDAAPVCVFPTALRLDISETGADAALRARLFRDGPVYLPHAPGVWPEKVLLDGRPWPVAASGGQPMAWLPPGDHRLTARLNFSRTPDSLVLPREAALVTVIRDGKPVAAPLIDRDGRLSLSTGERPDTRPEDTLSVSLFRLFRDGAPFEVTTLARLDVSGLARRLTVDGVAPPGATVMNVRSDLPLGFDAEGRVHVQADPGRHEIEVTARYPGRVASLPPAACPYGPEIWVFVPDRAFREVELSGAPAVDPSATDLPPDWKRHRAYLLDKGGVLVLTETHRGEPTPPRDEPTLERTMWLDFDGRGLTVKDRLGGRMARGRTLTLPGPLVLGRVSAAGRDQPIVLLGPDARPGVEIREAGLDLVAESRLPDFDGLVPMPGWDRECRSVSATLNLPPGFRLLAATGPDAVSASMLGRFTLLDLFVILLGGLAAWKLRGPAAGLCLIVFLALSIHQPGAPVGVWLALLAALAIFRAVVESPRSPLAGEKARRVALILLAGTVLGLTLQALPFVFTELRYGFYPQLAPPEEAVAPRMAVQATGGSPAAKASRPAGRAGESAPADMAVNMAMPEAPPPPAPMSANDGSRPEPRERVKTKYDPESLVPTGPGVPAWRFSSVRLTWNGPVAEGQRLGLYLLTPGLSLAVALVRVGLLVAALFFLLDPRRLSGLIPSAGRVAAAVLLLPLLSAPAMAADFPPREMLDELSARLTAPARCAPDCLGAGPAVVRVEGRTLTLLLSLDAAATTVAPLPVVSGDWRPAKAILDEKGEPDLVRQDGRLYLVLPEGAHRLALIGPVPEEPRFDVSFPLPPGRVEVEAEGYGARGLGPDRTVQGVLTLAREAEPEKDLAPLPSYVIAPFFVLERTIDMDLEWRSTVVVRRLTPPGEPAVLRVPLLPGESVTDGPAAVRDGMVELTMRPGDERLTYASRLTPEPRLELAAAEGAPWVETWTLRAGTMWDVSFSGLAQSAGFDQRGRFAPSWRPWPGEKVTIAATRPEAAKGEYVTIDKAVLTVRQGERLRDARLALDVRAARADRLNLRIPASARDVRLTAKGRELAVVGQPGEVAAPLEPGAQGLEVSWREDVPVALCVTAPAVDLGRAAVNVETRLHLPKDRWTLFVRGPSRLGPAVLALSLVVGVILAAAALGAIPGSPLGRRQWLLLCLGLTQASPGQAVLAAGWPLALWARGRYPIREGWFAFNAVQVLLVLLVLAGLGGLYGALETGLLGLPRMQVAGNGSTAHELIWTLDRVAGPIPPSEVYSAPLYVYRGLMLLWSLWLAASLLRWLRDGYDRFMDGGGWRAARLAWPRRRERAMAGPVGSAGPAGPSGVAGGANGAGGAGGVGVAGPPGVGGSDDPSGGAGSGDLASGAEPPGGEAVAATGAATPGPATPVAGGSERAASDSPVSDPASSVSGQK